MCNSHSHHVLIFIKINHTNYIFNCKAKPNKKHVVYFKIKKYTFFSFLMNSVQLLSNILIRHQMNDFNL